MLEKTIKCTAENVDEMKKVVREWPELHALVKKLQVEGLFPGLRSLQITLRGEKSWVDGGLAGLSPKNAPEGRNSGGEGRA
jgi:hypothetical protein